MVFVKRTWRYPICAKAGHQLGDALQVLVQVRRHGRVADDLSTPIEYCLPGGQYYSGADNDPSVIDGQIATLPIACELFHWFDQLRLPPRVYLYSHNLNLSNRPVRTRMPGGVA
jgi:hypothetical protein